MDPVLVRPLHGMVEDDILDGQVYGLADADRKRVWIANPHLAQPQMPHVYKVDGDASDMGAG